MVPWREAKVSCTDHTLIMVWACFEGRASLQHRGGAVIFPHERSHRPAIRSVHIWEYEKCLQQDESTRPSCLRYGTTNLERSLTCAPIGILWLEGMGCARHLKVHDGAAWNWHRPCRQKPKSRQSKVGTFSSYTLPPVELTMLSKGQGLTQLH